MDSIDTRGFYENYVNAINNHHFDRMEAFYSRSIRFRLYDTVQNFDELIDGLSGINSAFPDWHWKVLEMLFDGELITARYVVVAGHQGCDSPTLLNSPRTVAENSATCTTCDARLTSRSDIAISVLLFIILPRQPVGKRRH